MGKGGGVTHSLTVGKGYTVQAEFCFVWTFHDRFQR